MSAEFSTDFSDCSRQKFDTGRFVPPRPDEIKALFAKHRLSTRRVAEIVGMKHNRTVRRWTSGEVEIQYPVWRLLLYETGELDPRPID